MNGLLIGQNVTYACMEGYRHVDGDLVWTCGIDGLWQGEDPVCEGMATVNIVHEAAII